MGPVCAFREATLVSAKCLYQLRRVWRSLDRDSATHCWLPIWNSSM